MARAGPKRLFWARAWAHGAHGLGPGPCYGQGLMSRAQTHNLGPGHRAYNIYHIYYIYGVVWYGVVWCGMVCYGVVMVWNGVVWCGLVWFVWYGVVWKIALCQNRHPTRAPEIPYGAIGTELRCACGGMGGLWCGVVYGGMVWWCGMVWYVCRGMFGVVWYGPLFTLGGVV